jgi:uncharacterized damage-inducible protein DinB
MEQVLIDAFLRYSAAKLNQQAGRIEDCVGRLTPEQVWARGAENENAIGNLVLHLCGNVRQWIVSGVGQTPDDRDRDAEFAARAGAAPSELAARLRRTIEEAVLVLGQTTPARLAETVTIQDYSGTVLEAIYHVVEHFSGHTGQIIFATKRFTGEDLGYYHHLKRAAHGQKTP